MKLLIENLNSSISSEDLSCLLGGSQRVIKSWIKQDKYGISEGFGYARFESLLEGRQAILRCNGMKMYGRKIKLTQIKEIPLATA